MLLYAMIFVFHNKIGSMEENKDPKDSSIHGNLKSRIFKGLKLTLLDKNFPGYSGPGKKSIFLETCFWISIYKT